MSFDFHAIIVFLGAIQGLILALFLFGFNRKRRRANTILAWLILVYSINLLVPELSKLIYQDFPHLISSADWTLFLFGPLIYFYTLFLTGQSNRFTSRDVIHFIPALVNVLTMIPFYSEEGAAKLDFVADVFAHGFPTSLVIGWALACFHVAIYMGFTLRLIGQYQEQIKTSFSNLDKINLNWLRMIVIGSIVVWLLDAAMLITNQVGWELDGSGVLSHTIAYFTSFFIYFIGYKSMIQPEVFRQMNVASGSVMAKAKYERSGLAPSQALAYKTLLEELMEDESPYLNPEISLTDLSEMLAIPSNHLSQVLNEQFSLNFFDFINSYRVHEAQSWLSDPVRSKATMLAIAFESGFKSKSTFNAAFRKHLGMTPSEYKKSQSGLKTA